MTTVYLNETLIINLILHMSDADKPIVFRYIQTSSDNLESSNLLKCLVSDSKNLQKLWDWKNVLTYTWVVNKENLYSESRKFKHSVCCCKRVGDNWSYDNWSNDNWSYDNLSPEFDLFWSQNKKLFKLSNVMKYVHKC